jgi:hypothetical protein
MRTRTVFGYALLACPMASCATTYDSAPGIGLGSPPEATQSTVRPSSSELPSQSDRGSRRPGPWEVTLGGAGVSNDVWDAGGAQAAASVGYYLNESLEVSVRQNGSYDDAGRGQSEAWNGSSRVALDVHIPFGCFVPYVGANFGYVYGDSVEDSMMGGPELGAKIYVKEDAFLLLATEYQFFFDRGDSLNTAFDEGQFLYGLSIGLRF